jgi:nitrate reductase gamma subunit
MNDWIDIARGPLFAVSFLIMLLGLGRLVALQLGALIFDKGRRLKQVPWRQVAVESLGWAVPLRHLVPGTILLSSASFLFHVGAVLVPLFCSSHVLLWEESVGIHLPALGRGIGDVLTLTTIACCLLLLGYRIAIRRARDLSRPSDYLILALVLLPFVSGYLAHHPRANPFPWSGTMLFHLLSAEALMIAVPFTKLSHIALFVFDRLSVVHWQLRPGAGEEVAAAVLGEQARV